ncbi:MULTISPECIES: NAD-dependent epimerase/dehydratase family protein [Maribacter]|uniref:NAD-dependent epimerase/dehydratase family protein n=1 Tax=Maribacter flavus TaxID=1658664 RepID=A0ABU7IEF6_9FLAO|nr:MULTISPECIES: NAD-dependent epimerase/dehydratase family protein [Maribacter]MDC6404186.1 NAD-dependent epimerase/dehydratase family protein [Maribacter sp. PR66]MEE1971329.1 NAD-dependent epimerase/dehydratase family protein [Maribacter flavus]
MKEILVFGGFGFLGHYLVKELLRRQYSVTVADIAENEELIDQVTHHYCDISDRNQVSSIFKGQQFDIVYNLAGFANLDNAIKHPIKTMNLNVLGNMYILEECVKQKVDRFIYASSAYAMSNKGSFYGVSKLASEKIIEEYHKKYNLPFVILRYGSVYSERPYDNNYIYNLVKKAVKEKRIDHHGDGNEIREYIHAADAAKLSVDVIESDSFSNLHVILTGTERMKRLELFQMINEILNNQVEVNCSDSGYQNHYKFTPYSFEPSVSKKLTANPHIDMGQGLLECIRAVHNE